MGVLLTLVPASAASAERVEYPGLRTDTSRTYRVAPDRYVTRFFTQAVNFRDGRGGWRAIDGDLVRSARRGFALRPEATPYRLDLPRTLGDPVHFAHGDDWVTFALVGARGAAGAATGNSARYLKALPATDVRYDTLNDGIKETLVLRDATAPRRYRFVLRTSLGLEPRLDDGGRVNLVRPDGTVAFHFAAPFMEDAAGALSTKVGVDLQRRIDGWAMTLSPDARWLRDPGRAWPVKLDPTVRVATSTECAYIRETSNASATQCDNPDFVVGGGGDKRPLIRFDVRALPFASAITSAQMRLHNSGDPGTVSAHQATTPWTALASWHYYDRVNRWANLGGDFVSTAAATTSVALGWNSWDLEPLVQLWVDGLQPNEGVILMTSDWGSPRLATSQRGAATAPYLDVTYVTETVAPVMEPPQHTPSPPPAGWVDNVSLSVKGTATDVGVGLERMTLTEPRPTVFQQHKYFCDITQPATCEATDSTKCGGTWTSRCPITGSKTFNYTTGPFSEGIVRPNLFARDAASNDSSPRDWTLKVDHSKPTLDTPIGELYVRRNRADDRRFEGLYGPSYTVDVVARDGSATVRRSGVKSIAWRVFDVNGNLMKTEDDTQPSTRPCSATEGCHHELQGSYTLNADSLQDGDYRMRIVAYDQLDHDSAPTDFWFTVDRSGDIYTAREWAGAANAGGYEVAMERHALNTMLARRNEQGFVGTRGVTACSQNTSQQCGEVRELTIEGDLGPAAQHLDITRGTTVGDARLDAVAAIREIAVTATGQPTASGDIYGAMGVWQHGPPAHGATFERYDRTETVDVNGQLTTITRRMFVDATTRLPIRDIVLIGGTTERDTYYTYDRSRLDRSQVPANEFAIDRSDPQGTTTTVDYAMSPPPDETDEGGSEDPAPSSAKATSYRQRHALTSDATTVNTSLSPSTNPTYNRSMGAYGMPLLPTEFAEMNERNRAIDAVRTTIDQYGATTGAGTYGGAWLDHAGGGVIRVGFTQNATPHLQPLKALFPYPSRVVVEQVSATLATLESVTDQVGAQITSLESEGIVINSLFADVSDNTVKVGVSNPTSTTEQTLRTRFGPEIKLEAALPFTNGSHTTDPKASRLRTHRPIPPVYAGLKLYARGGRLCSSAFSLIDTPTPTARARRRILSAGHCATGLVRGDPWSHAGKRAGGVRDAIVGNVQDGDQRRGIDAMLLRTRAGYISSLVYVHPGERDAFRAITKSVTIEENPRGKKLCVIGFRRTPPRCATLKSLKATVRGAEGLFYRFGLFEADGESAERGDSGGAIIPADDSDTTAYGVWKGWETFPDGQLAPRPFPRMIFTPITTVTRVFDDFRVLTSR